ncbi:MAG: shikimate kinase [bacterium]|nr:shikimate kinase [bacterium]
MKRVVICGFMGTGKTTCGKIVAKELKMQFIDTDIEVEKKLGMSISEIFLKYGESKFREEETKVIDTLPISDVVVAVGGGAVINEKNVANLRNNSVIVCLWANPETIYMRLKKHEDRPLLFKNKFESIVKLLEIRKIFYKRITDFHINTDNKSVSEVVDEIINIYEKNKQ